MTRILVVDDDQPSAACPRASTSPPAATPSTWRRTVRTRWPWPTQHPPNLVIVDLGLPDMDGVDVIEGIRGWLHGPGHRALRPSSRSGQGARAGRRRRRLRDQTVRHGRAAGSGSARHCAGRRHRPTREPPITTDAFTVDLAARRVDPRRRRRPADPDRMAPAGSVGTQPGPTRRPTPAAAGGVGPTVRVGDQLPAGVRRPAARESSNRIRRSRAI